MEVYGFGFELLRRFMQCRACLRHGISFFNFTAIPEFDLEIVSKLEPEKILQCNY
jgi:hypothetical protein